MKRVVENFKKIGLTRHRRVNNYLELLEEKITIKNKEDLELISDLRMLIDERVKAIKGLQIIIIIAYFGIYFSFVSFFLSGFFISEVTTFISNIVGFFGTTLFILVLFFANRLSALHYQDIMLFSSHYIAIYEKYDTHDKDSIFGELNHYNKFIQFFKSRGI